MTVDERYQRLEDTVRAYNPTASFDKIRAAYEFAAAAHQGQLRKDGSPFVTHPLAVAQIVAEELHLDSESIEAALLHDTIEDTDATHEDIAKQFSPTVADLVEGVSKLTRVHYTSKAQEQMENLRKMLLAMSKDIRVILIKIADRLHNMRTLGAMPLNKQIKITSETIYLFAPLAYRLGLFAIKTELEDLCMKYRFPEQYEEISRKLDETEASRQEFIARFNAPIVEALRHDGINFEISARVKSIYSIWMKMQRKQIPFEEVYDLFAIRIVFKPLPFPSEKTQCYQIYATITDIYTPKPDRLRDWINTPKANGYEALHSTVMSPDGVWVEVQIRTQRMDDIAERGVAAHWKYKQETISQNEDELDKWLKKIRDALNSPTENAVDFLDNFKLSLYTSEIVVFTPKGEPRRLPFGATALDFAYDIHTNVGNKAIGAKINHKLEPVTTQISSGDQIEIITADNARPKAEWLDLVTTSKAKQSIKNFLKREQQNNIERGMATLTERLAKLNINLSGRVLRKLVPAYECATKEEFYSKIGAGIIRLDDIEKHLKVNSASKILKFWTLFIPKKAKPESEDDETPAIDEAADDTSPEFVVAECCKPIPGDKVVGFRDPQSGKIIVHKATCEELNRLASQFGRNIIKDEIKWSQHKAVSYLSTIELRGIDRTGILLDLANVISRDFSINIREIGIQSHDGIFEGTLSLYVKNAESLSVVLENLRKIKGMESVKRNL